MITEGMKTRETFLQEENVLLVIYVCTITRVETREWAIEEENASNAISAFHRSICCQHKFRFNEAGGERIISRPYDVGTQRTQSKAIHSIGNMLDLQRTRVWIHGADIESFSSHQITCCKCQRSYHISCVISKNESVSGRSWTSHPPIELLKKSKQFICPNCRGHWNVVFVPIHHYSSWQKTDSRPSEDGHWF